MTVVDGEPCADCSEFGAEHFGPTTNGTTTAPWDGSASRFSDAQYRMATAACDPGDSPPKTACFLPHHEPGGAVNINGVHAAAGAVSKLSGHDAGAVSKAKSHLRAHYAALKEDPPDSIQAAQLMAEIEEIMSTWGDGPNPCPTCKGSGKIRAGNVTCPDCGGSGNASILIDAESEINADLLALFSGVHGLVNGTHSHPHAAYGTQGDDSTHDHSHIHNGDNLHSHEHPATAAATPQGRRPSMAASFRLETTFERALSAAGCPVTSPENRMLGSSWAIEHDGNYWHVLSAGANLWTTVDSYTEALDAIAAQLAEQADTRPVLTDSWKSEMAYEGVSTGDGRKIAPGAIQYRATPLPLMLQTETAGGHQGAVLAGAIDKTGMLGQIALGAGDFDATDAGKSAVQILQARGKFGVSIDVAEAEGAPSCPDHGTDTDQCDPSCDWEILFSLIRVMGLTMTPFPAFEDAYIELVPAPEPAAASAAPTVMPNGTTVLPVDGLGVIEFVPEAQTTGGSATFTVTGGTGTVTAGAFQIGSHDPYVSSNGNGGGDVEWTTEDSPLLAAAAAAASAPPVGWFAPPDGWGGNLVRQPSGRMVCPFTVEEPDPAHGNLRRCYGHMADWFTCHTGIPNRCVTAPHSKTDYAAFNLRPLPTAEGDLVRVGHLTMGCGHATTDPAVPVGDVRAHYDGGPGAVRMAHVHMGEDQYGPWVAGYVEPGATPEQVRTFSSCSLSGDWREVWRGRGLECVACLAGVTVPGFPIAAAALIAAGVSVPLGVEIGPTRIGWRNEQPVSLVAAGIIRQPMPWERQLAAAEAALALALDRITRLEQTTAPLIPLAASAKLEEMGLAPAPVVEEPPAEPVGVEEPTAPSRRRFSDLTGAAPTSA